MINATDRIPRQSIFVAGHSLSIAVAGAGPPLVLLHGSATNAYLWRNLIPFLAREHRCLAPDLPGMGDSPSARFENAQSYSFEELVWTTGEVIKSFEPTRPVVLIGHELGALIAAEHARRHPSSVAGLVFIEGSFRVTNDTQFAPDIRDFLAEVRGPKGADMILTQDLLTEYYLNRLTLRHLGPEELRGYRRASSRPHARRRRAMLSMIRQLPLRSHPGPIDSLASEIRVWCSRTTIPKLVIGGSPGFLVPQPILATTARWSNTTTAQVRGLHFLMEDSPARITSVVLEWLDGIGHTFNDLTLSEQSSIRSASADDPVAIGVVDVDDSLPGESLLGSPPSSR
jgi:haloalkane dehalogenase